MSSKNKQYYDAFSSTYDEGRDRGYHRLIDEQAVELVRRVGKNRNVLEVGCGTGLLLEQVASFASTAKGVDLSPGMLDKARSRGLDVEVADCTKLPFADGQFDVVYSFKVLAHVQDLVAALDELHRVVKPGGHIVFDTYNRHSIRYLIKRVFGPSPTSNRFKEDAILTRFLSPSEAGSMIKQSSLRDCSIEQVSGIRVFVPHPVTLRIPILRRALEGVEWAVMDSALGKLGGFVVFTLSKRDTR